MAQTEQELKELKEKVEKLNEELKELSTEELQQVAGGMRTRDHYAYCWNCQLVYDYDEYKKWSGYCKRDGTRLTLFPM